MHGQIHVRCKFRALPSIDTELVAMAIPTPRPRASLMPSPDLLPPAAPRWCLGAWISPIGPKP